MTVNESTVSTTTGGTAAPLESGSFEPACGSLHARLDELAERVPDDAALKQGPETITFSELNALADAVAGELADSPVSQGALVAVWSPVPATQLVLSFGAWKAGMSVVIMDTRDPETRVRRILEHGRVEAVLAEQDAAVSAVPCRPLPVVSVQPRAVGEYVGSAAVGAHSPAVVVFTSGSEGRPKGVLRTHANMVGQWQRESGDIGIRSSDRVAQLHPLNFSAGLKHALNAVLSGAGLCFYDVQSRGLAPFAGWIREEGISILPSPVAFFRRFLHHVADTQKLTMCRCVVLGGERLYRRDVERIRDVFGGGCRVVYTYGATECGGIARNIIEPGTHLGDSVLPVGAPCEGRDIRIVGTDGRAMPAGRIGEIAVVAPDLPPGYWQDAESTSRKYRSAPEGGGRRMYLTGDYGRIGNDGALHLYGRNDRQLKIRGYRVEIGEIEAFLNSAQGVVHAVVIASEDARGAPSLTAYVTFSGDAEDRALLLKHLKRTAARGLPAYMVPDDFVVLDVMPTTSRGKIDRRALDDLAGGDAASAGGEPATDTERRVIEIWERVLQVEGITVDDDILDLGVKSLSGMELCLVLGKVFSVEVPYAQLTQSPTVRELAAFIDSKTAEKTLR